MLPSRTSTVLLIRVSVARTSISRCLPNKIPKDYVKVTQGSAPKVSNVTKVIMKRFKIQNKRMLHASHNQATWMASKWAVGVSTRQISWWDRERRKPEKDLWQYSNANRNTWSTQSCKSWYSTTMMRLQSLSPSSILLVQWHLANSASMMTFKRLR